jgi:hypothetical protein
MAKKNTLGKQSNVVVKTLDAIEEVKDALERVEVELAAGGIDAIGSHTIYFKGFIPIHFKDGKANVLRVTAEILRKEGLVK